ncbi:hypothetical protein DC498_17070 [Terrimonas sp.]|uniref:DUF2480 family protein n=1 Tax=Terrimonas sp. TaxID=1914338 RepID=UPI000D51E00E|nr:DUF2480 family protein [Terrimonas sp.]PVD51125.1 hypothetical protein DC498_17070 [Terrimonas sp.]
MEEIINKVAESGIITINLEAFFPKDEIAIFDLKPWLFRELILKEKEFREALKNADWEQYKDKVVGLTNTADAIIPMWAYMLVASYLQPHAKEVLFGDEQLLTRSLMLKNIEQISAEEYIDKRIVIKGCGDIVLPEAAYVAITNKLKPVVKSLMYGEPCSTVPVYKKSVQR